MKKMKLQDMTITSFVTGDKIQGGTLVWTGRAGCPGRTNEPTACADPGCGLLTAFC